MVQTFIIQFNFCSFDGIVLEHVLGSFIGNNIFLSLEDCEQADQKSIVAETPLHSKLTILSFLPIVDSSNTCIEMLHKIRLFVLVEIVH